jgi:hypothetical protein
LPSQEQLNPHKKFLQISLAFLEGVKHNKSMVKQFTSASCPTCDTLFERLPVEYDEDGGYAFLEMHPCAGCGKMLCACCDQFHCDGCGQTFRADHLVSVPDGTDSHLHCCEACAAEYEPLELPARIPPQSEVLARPHLEAA